MAAQLLLRQAARPLRQQLRGMSAIAYKDTLLNTPETRITTLANGFRVATEKTAHNTATVGLYIDAGSRFENAKNNGTAHFLEHMAFKGTPKRTQHALEVEVENMGALLNAYTSREQTVYYAKCFSKDVDHATEILSDILQNASLGQPQIEQERGVILRESKEVNQQPEEVVLDYLHATAFQGNSLGFPILGSEDNIRSITRDDLKSYIQTHYTAPRMVLAAAGGVDHDALVKTAEKLFGGLSPANNAANLPRAQFVGSDIRARDDSMPFAHVALAVEGVGSAHPNYFPLMVASAIVGSWDRSHGGGANMSSKLAQIVSKDHLANSFMSFNTCYSDTGLWGAYAVCEHESIEDFIFELQQEWLRIATNCTKADVERAKNQVKALLLFQADGTTAVCDEIGRQMLTYGRRLYAAELDARLEAIDAKLVQAVANEHIFDKCPALVGLGPIEQLTDYNRVRSQMFWSRA